MTIPPLGQVPRRADIAGISTANPCEVTTVDLHEYETGNFVRITDLNSSIPTPRGMNQINNKLFEIEVSGEYTFFLRNTTTHEYIDATDFTPYVIGGRCNLDNHFYIFEP